MIHDKLPKHRSFYAAVAWKLHQLSAALNVAYYMHFNTRYPYESWNSVHQYV